MPAKKEPGPPTRHTAFIHDRGGREQLFQIKQPSKITYNRKRDDQSDATVTVSPTGRRRQLAQLLSAEPGRHELYIFRGQRLAWCGPLNLPTSMNRFGEFTINAKDITLYLDRTPMRAAYSNRYPNIDFVVNRMQTIMTAELARKEALGYNLLDHLHFYTQEGDARTGTATPKYAMSVFDHLDDLAAKAGIDYTVHGRELHVWDTSRPALGQLQPVGRRDFLSDPVVKKFGSELATEVVATDGQGGFGIAGQEDPYYGEWVIINQAYDQDEDTARPTTAELQSQAKLSLKGRNPTPLSLAVPSNSGINPRSKVLNPDVMIPGVYVPLRLDIGEGHAVTQMQKLQDMSVTDSEAGEVVTMSLYPATASDEDTNAEA